MGLGSSSPEDEEMRNKVQSLISKNVCKLCVQRYLMLDKVRINKFYPEDLHPLDCSACCGILHSIPLIKRSIVDAVGDFKYHDVQIEMPKKMQECDEKFNQDMGLSSSCNIKHFLRAKFNAELPRTPEGPTLLITISSFDRVRSSLKWPNVYLYGVYQKNSRRVSHSRFFVGRPLSSVDSEIIKAVSKYFRCSQITFESAGREDADVRMLGSGRPFCLHINNPVPFHGTNPKDINDFVSMLSEKIPDSIECENFVSISKLRLCIGKPFLNPKHMKKYRCVISCSNEVSDEMLERINSASDITLKQRTPLRVAHRRGLMIREKKIVSLSAQRISKRFFILDLETNGGTYIKEFVSSDFGRTEPFLGQIMEPNEPVQCQIHQLDVVFVEE